MASYDHCQKLRIIKLQQNRNVLTASSVVAILSVCIVGVGADAAAHHLPQIIMENFPNTDLAMAITKETIEKFEENIKKIGLPTVFMASGSLGTLALIMQARIKSVMRKIVRSRKPEDYGEYTSDEKKEYWKNGKDQVNREVESYKREVRWDQRIPQPKKR